MKSLVAALALLVTTSADAGEIVFSWQILNSGAFPCTGEPRAYRWQNPFGRDMAIVRSRLWIGAQGGLQADIDQIAMIFDPVKGWVMLNWQQLDLYNGRPQQQERPLNHDENWYRLPADAWVYLQLTCMPVFGASGNVHGSLDIGISEVPTTRWK